MQKKRLAHSTLVYLVLGFLPLASSFLLTPVYTQYLSPEEYGVIALANVLQTYLSLAVSIGLDAAFSRFYFSHYKDEALTSSLLSTCVITILLLTLVVGSILYIAGDALLYQAFKEPSFSYTKFGFQILITSGLGMIYNLTSQYYRDAEKLRSFSIMAIMYFILLTFCTYYGVVIAQNGAEGSINGKMTGTVATMVIIIATTLYRTGIKFNFKLLKELLIYSSPLLLYAIMAAVFDTMDRFFVKYYFDIGVLGQYNFAFIIASVIGIVITSYQSAVNPPIYKMLLEKNGGHAVNINVLMKRFVWVAMLFAGLCIVLAYVLIRFFINPSYHPSINIIPILALSFIPRSYYIVWSYPLFTENKTRLLPVINAASIIAGILSNVILIPIAGIYGVAFSVIVIKSVQAAGALYFSRKLGIWNSTAFSLNDVSFSVIVFAILAVASAFLPYTNSYYPLLMFVLILITTGDIILKNRNYLKSILKFNA